MTATSAAIGMRETTGPHTMHRTIRKTPARKVDNRVRAPDTFTLIIVWPIIAQPPIPPKKPVTMFATPWPTDSRVLSERVSVISSTSFAVISDSISPTTAMARAYGATRTRVSRVKGTSGRPGTGREEGSAPLSPTVGTAMPAATVIAVRIAMDTSGAGTTLLIFGKNTIRASPCGDQRIHRPRHVPQLGDLGHEDEDGEGVDEADHHRTGNEPDQLRHPERAQHDLEDATRITAATR